MQLRSKALYTESSFRNKLENLGDERRDEESRCQIVAVREQAKQDRKHRDKRARQERDVETKGGECKQGYTLLEVRKFCCAFECKFGRRCLCSLLLEFCGKGWCLMMLLLFHCQFPVEVGGGFVISRDGGPSHKMSDQPRLCL
jgi:hypothetical protein